MAIEGMLSPSSLITSLQNSQRFIGLRMNWQLEYLKRASPACDATNHRLVLVFSFEACCGTILVPADRAACLLRKKLSSAVVTRVALIMDIEGEQLNDLMRRYGRGEDMAFGPLYEMMAPRLHRFCHRLAAAGADADDLFQETFLRVHRARATYMTGGNALHWAFAIARSVCRDRLRYRRRRPEDLGSANDVTEDDRLLAGDSERPEAELLAHALAQVVRLELGKMSEKNRVAYVLIREEGLTVKEAAATLGTTADVVKKRAHRAYEQLRIAVDAAGWRQ
jgi:RNA polymerase sigma-70 factor (ECF subfamily)